MRTREILAAVKKSRKHWEKNVDCLRRLSDFDSLQIEQNTIIKTIHDLNSPNELVLSFTGEDCALCQKQFNCRERGNRYNNGHVCPLQASHEGYCCSVKGSPWRRFAESVKAAFLGGRKATVEDATNWLYLAKNLVTILRAIEDNIMIFGRSSRFIQKV